MRKPILFSTIVLFGMALPAQQQQIAVDWNGATTPFPHFWEQMFGSGRASLTLRESYQSDARAVKQVSDFRYVRFHAILHDENGVYNEDEHGNPVYNFAYVDQIYDSLLALGIRPCVEISFMPKKLAFNPDALHPFWYKQNVSPPKSMERWDGLVTAFGKHLVERYGIDEVSQWYFEVWNEPNIDFWGGIPRKASYFELYAHTARALKAVNPRLRVGGPATAAAQWIPDFVKFASENHVPVDFISSHGYADDTVADMFGVDGELPPNSPYPTDMPMDERVCRAIAKVRGEIQASALKDTPLFWTEWNVQGDHESRDTTFVGAGLANTIRQCDGKGVQMMSFWTFSDVFEEGGPIARPFGGEFGLRAKGGINKPSYYAFALLHQLGDRRIPVDSDSVIATRAADGSLRIAAWNIADPGTIGKSREIDLKISGATGLRHVSVQRVDNEHGNVLPRYAAMGKPLDPTPSQVKQLNRGTELGKPETAAVHDGTVHLTLEPNALVLVTTEASAK